MLRADGIDSGNLGKELKAGPWRGLLRNVVFRAGLSRSSSKLATAVVGYLHKTCPRSSHSMPSKRRGGAHEASPSAEGAGGKLWLQKKGESFLFFSFAFLLSRDGVSLCSPGCPGTRSVNQAGLELINPPTSASQGLGSQACATTAWLM